MEVTSIDDYKARVEEILGAEFANGEINLSLAADSVGEAKNLHKRLVLQQKQLRQVKREINNDMKHIRALHKQASANAQPSGGSLIMGLFGKKGYQRSDVAEQRKQLRKARDNALYPYTELKQTIDDILVQMDYGKLTIKEWLEEQKQ